MKAENAEFAKREVVRLYGPHGLPAAIFALPESCAKPHGSFAYGIDQSNAAETVRALAGEIESGGVLLQRVSHTTRATNEDFVMHHVTLSFAAKRS